MTLRNNIASTECERRAYQAGQNIVRLSRYREQQEQLETLRAKFAAAIIREYSKCRSVEHIEEAISFGWHVISSGESIEEAMRLAAQQMQELAR